MGKKSIVISIILILLLTAIASASHNSKKRAEFETASKSPIEKAEHYRMFGKFNIEDDQIYGKFVNFSFDEDTGIISDYVLVSDDASITVFKSVTPSFSEGGEVSVNGSVFKFRTDNLMIKAHNNPTRLLMHKSLTQNITIDYLLDENINIKYIYNNTLSNTRVGLNCTNFEGVLVIAGLGNIRIVEGHIYVDLVNNSQSIFRAHPESSEESEIAANRNEIVDAIAEGKVGGELSITVNETFAEDSIIYQNLTNLHTEFASVGKIKINVSADTHEGKVVIVNLDRETMPISNRNEVLVKIDNTIILQTESLTDLLESSSSDGCYYVTIASSKIQFLVYVPQFSHHTISIEKLSEVQQNLTLANLLVITGAIVVIIIAVWILYRRRD